MGDVNKSLAKWIDKLGVESRCETEIMDILQSDNISDKELGIFIGTCLIGLHFRKQCPQLVK